MKDNDKLTECIRRVGTLYLSCGDIELKKCIGKIIAGDFKLQRKSDNNNQNKSLYR